MGFSGGGGGVLTNHRHDTGVTNDGGALAANATVFGLSNQSILVSDGSNIQELTIGSDGTNLGVTGGAITWAASVHSILADILVLANSTTIGDYTQPASATCSSEDLASPTVEYDFSSSTGWITSDAAKLNVAGGALQIYTTAGSKDWIYKDITGSVITGDFVIRYSATFTTMGAEALGLQWHGVTDTAGASAADTQDELAIIIYDDNNNFLSSAMNNQAPQAASNQGALSPQINPTTTTYYIELIHDSSDWVTNVYSDTGFSTLLGTRTLADNGVTNLRYFTVQCYTTGADVGYINDLKFWAGVTSINGACSKAVDDDTSTYWTSTSSTNPNIYVDMSSSTTTSNIAIYPNTLTTETEIKIQSSTNATDWTDKRTITYSNLTEAAWNYIRFNLTTAQYWRIYGNSGGAGVLAIDEIKVLDGVSDADVRTLHGHRSISSSDTSLDNAGV